jgi:hypothetical protein
MTEELISTTNINKVFGLTITSKLLKELGFSPVFETKTTMMWDKKNLTKMAIRISHHLLVIGESIND